jgi:hypothetical protein
MTSFSISCCSTKRITLVRLAGSAYETHFLAPPPLGSRRPHTAATAGCCLDERSSSTRLTRPSTRLPGGPGRRDRGGPRPRRRDCRLRISTRRRSGLGVAFVGVLGEGFDLPSLKIAAYHNPHRSLPVTIQFAGRVARTERTGDDDLGNPEQAVLIATVGDHPEILAELHKDGQRWDRAAAAGTARAAGAGPLISPAPAGRSATGRSRPARWRRRSGRRPRARGPAAPAGPPGP